MEVLCKFVIHSQKALAASLEIAEAREAETIDKEEAYQMETLVEDPQEHVFEEEPETSSLPNDVTSSLPIDVTSSFPEDVNARDGQLASTREPSAVISVTHDSMEIETASIARQNQQTQSAR